MAKLRFFREGSERGCWKFDGAAKMIGRYHPLGALSFNDTDVSREQFSIRLDGEKWKLKNYSRFGTVVDGATVCDEVELSPASEIRFGRWLAVCEIRPAEKPLSSGDGRRRTLTLPGLQPIRRERDADPSSR